MNFSSRLTVVILVIFMWSSPVRAGGSNTVCEEPNVMIVLDKSGSMRDRNKWNYAVSAVNQITNIFQSTMRIGLMFYPASGDCGTSSNPAAPCQINAGSFISQQLFSTNPNGGTPTGPALNEASNYFQALGDRDRRSFVVLVTDGEPTCRTSCNDARNAAQNLFNQDIPVFVIGFGSGTDVGCNNAVAQWGGTGSSITAGANTNELYMRLEDVFNRAREEVCDAKDNDCDGLVDEGLGERPCDTTCGQGIERCIDGRYTTCVGGEIPTESCNNDDDDCDGLVDENSALPCTTVSGQPGMQRCVNGLFEDRCTPNDPTREEICDGIDNDMNGQVDENTDELCLVDCHQGRRMCLDGILLDCSARPASEEVCNGIDDDCDGNIDEGEPCIDAEVCEDGRCLRQCVAGECGSGFACLDDSFCHPYPCEPACSENQRCVDQACYSPCLLNRDCETGDRCENQLCVQDPNFQPTNTSDNTPTADAGVFGDNTPTDDAGSQPQVDMSIIDETSPLPDLGLNVSDATHTEDVDTYTQVDMTVIDESSPTIDCRNDGRGCTPPFQCRKNQDGQYECLDNRNGSTNSAQPRDTTVDCRNDGRGCTAPFECRMDAEGRYGCTNAHTSNDGGVSEESTTTDSADVSSSTMNTSADTGDSGCQIGQQTPAPTNWLWLGTSIALITLRRRSHGQREGEG